MNNKLNPEQEPYSDRTVAAYRWKAEEAIRNWEKSWKPSRFLKRFAAALPPRGKVLDYGCGIGTDLAWLKGQGFGVEGIDGTAEFVEEARKRCPGVTVSLERFERVRLASRSRDGIWCNAALIHVPPETLKIELAKLGAALKAGGWLGLTLAWGSASGYSREDWIPGRYIVGYSKQALEPLFLGWKVRELRVTSGDTRKGRWIQVLATP